MNIENPNIENIIEGEPAENEPKTCHKLLEEFKESEESEKEKGFLKKEKLELNGKPKKDVYNITAPFKDGDEIYIAARFEERKVTGESKVAFFKEKNGVWELDETKPEFDNFEDPFIVKLKNGEIIFGGVEVRPSSTPEHPEWLEYETVFYKGKNINELKEFARGPERMKDIRPIELSDEEIMVFTRPEEETGKIDEGGWPKNIKKIGFKKINSFDDLNPKTIQSAERIEGQFAKDEWGGANELHLLKNGKIGVLGHIARCDDEGNRHYYATAFCFDPENGKSSPLKIIATRKNFPDGDARKDDLKDVIFSGGLIRNGDKTADLYCGLSDADAGRVKISDPFIEYEEKEKKEEEK